MRQLISFTVPKIGATILCDSNGTANTKTMTISVNCEMTIDEGRCLIAAISRGVEWLEQQRPGSKE